MIIPYLEIVAAFLLSAFVVIFGTGTPTHYAPQTFTASSTFAVTREIAPPLVSLPNLLTTSSAPAGTSSPHIEPVTPPTVIASSTPLLPPHVATSIKPVAVQKAVATTTPALGATLDPISKKLFNALVNVICISLTGDVRSISGSGVIIDPKGIILTNAHIAQYLLFVNYPYPHSMRCVIRSGSPAHTLYTAAPIFISSAWVKENPTVISEEKPTGTGEHDIALLAITGSATTTPAPSTFPYVPLAVAPPEVGDAVVIGSYPAGSLTSEQVRFALPAEVVFGSIKKLYTFATDTVDVAALGGSPAAQEGSSGGGVINEDGMLTGTITTSTIEGDFETRRLSAITAAYIRRDFLEETGKVIETLLSESTTTAVAEFLPKMAALEAELLPSL